MILKQIHKLKRRGIIILMMICPAIYFSQSSNCTTATQVSLTSGTACVNGTSAGAVTDNILYGSCNTVPVNMVWYTYVTNGSNNSFTITPGTLTNAEIVIYQGGCPNTGTLQTCATATGATPLVTSWGMTAGTQVWVGIASNAGVSGSFQFCVNSQPPVPGAGNTCAQAIPLCNMNTFTQNPMAANSSGQTPTCFASAPQTDIWLKFTISQAGTLAWTAMPSVLTTEFDWALWDVTAGCPGTLVCCNYNYAGGSTNGFGMQNSAGNIACGTSAGSLDPAQEFSPPIAVTCGQVYAIQISNFNNTTAGFSLSFPNSTCLVGSTSNFGVSPTLICGASLNAAITNSSTGTCNQVWNFGDGSATYTGGTPPNHNYTTPGTYAITASITGACPASFTQYVQLLAPLAATVTPTPVSCPSACNGVASVSAVTGGNGVYTYSWSTGATTNQITGLCTGVYSVTISNAVCGSSITKTVSITAPPPFTVTPGSNSPVCAGGTLSLTATGGTTYSWSGPAGYTSTAQNPTIASVSPANAGVYTVTATTTGCSSTATVNVVVASSPSVTVSSATICAGGSATLNASGASTYTWNPPTGLSSVNGSMVTASPAATTIYTVSGSVGSCTASPGTGNMLVNPNPTVTIGSNSPVCAGSALNLTSGGGTTYVWSGPGAYTSTLQNPTIASAVVANSGVYTVTATTSGCSATNTVNVTVNALPSPTVSSNSPICSGAALNLTSGGGTTYAWSGPGGYTSTLQNPSINPAAATNSGVYTVTATTSGCSSTATVNVTVNTTPTVTIGSNSPVCVGAALNLTSGGGTTYAWIGPGAYTSTLQNPTIASAAVANSGVYTVTATTSGCSGTNTVNVTVVASPTVAVSSNTPCPAGTFSLTAASDGTSYNWSGPGAFTSTVQNPTIANAGPATAGIYTAVVSNTTGCSTTSTVNATVNAAASPTASSSGTICAGQTLTLTVSSAGAGATYQWTGPNGFTSAIQSPSIANAPVANSGVYTVTVTSSAGCSGTTTVNAQVNAIPVVTIGSNSPICAGTALNLTSGGGTTYTWSGPGAYTSTLQNPTIAAAAVANSGVYTVTATTAGCSATNTVNVTVNALPSPTVSSNSPICSGASLNLVANGGTTYAWSGPGAYTSALQNPSINPADATNSGVYTVTATTAGCSASATVNVTVNTTPTVTIGSNSPICAGSALNLTSGGGTTYAWSGPGAYTSAMQNPVINPALATNSGVYTVTATTSGCSATNTVNVTVNTAVVASINPLPQACLNSTVNLNSPAGATTYAWSGPNGFTSTQQNPQITGVTSPDAGVYSLTLTTNGCTSITTASLAVTGPVSFSIVPAGQAVCQGRSAPLSALGQGGTGTYGYSWSPATGISSPNAPSVIATPNTTQTYTVTVSDVNCPTAPTATVAVTVTVNPLPVITFSTPIASGCETFCTSFSSQSVPAAQTSSWIFSNGQTASGANPGPICFNPHGSYGVKLIVQDVNGCVDSLNKPGYITVYPKPVADFTWDPLSPTIITSEVHFYDQSAVGGPMHQWHWDFGDFYVPYAADTTNLQNPSHIYSSIGSYNVTLAIMNQYGCRDTVTKKITVDDEFAFYIPNAFSPNEPDGVNDIFNVKGTGFLSDSFEMYIFDRWGEQIYFTDNVFKGWDGTAKNSGVRAKQDVYVYKIILKDFHQTRRQYVGHVTLL